jgi:hypothetical protein
LKTKQNKAKAKQKKKRDKKRRKTEKNKKGEKFEGEERPRQKKEEYITSISGGEPLPHF